jgi:hypothetical protein
MPKHNPTVSVPKSMKMKYTEIIALTDSYCSKNLNEEYAQLVHLATAALCRKKLSPVQLGSVSIWAGGIIWAVGFINFLFDKSTSPYVNAEELANAFGAAKSTVSNKSKQIRDLLKMNQFDHRWYLPSRIESSSMVWTIMYNGFMLDARTLHREIQVVAYEKGLIPYVYADKI